jgi:hypothetical protein
MKFIDRITLANPISDNDWNDRLVGYVVCNYDDTLKFNTSIEIKKTSLNDMLQVIETTLWVVTDENETIAKQMTEAFIDSRSMTGNRYEII